MKKQHMRTHIHTYRKFERDCGHFWRMSPFYVPEGVIFKRFSSPQRNFKQIILLSIELIDFTGNFLLLLSQDVVSSYPILKLFELKMQPYKYRQNNNFGEDFTWSRNEFEDSLEKNVWNYIFVVCLFRKD